MSYTVRPATHDDAQGITHVHVQSWRSSYRGLLPQQFLDSLDSTERLAMWQKTLSQPEVFGVFVALAPGRGDIVGFCAGGKSRGSPAGYAGELYAIYLLDEAKGSGAGRALFQECSRWLREHELMPFSLWVLADNARARRFYERMGGQLAGEQSITLGDQSFPEVAYGWRT